MRASLPMYDLPELRVATDAWWLGVAQAAARHGVDPVPLRLDRTEPSAWGLPDLLLSQCCGRDLVTHLAGQVEAVAIPHYRAAGCACGTYRSWLVALRADPRQRLEDFFGSTAAVNYTGSHSGWVALGHALVKAGLSGPLLCPGRQDRRSPRLAGGRRPRHGRSCRHRLCDLCSPGAGRSGGDRIVADHRRERSGAGATLHNRRRPSGQARTQLLKALMDAVSDPTLATARSDLLLEGFLPIEGDPYARSIAMANGCAPPGGACRCLGHDG